MTWWLACFRGLLFCLVCCWLHHPGCRCGCTLTSGGHRKVHVRQWIRAVAMAYNNGRWVMNWKTEWSWAYCNQPALSWMEPWDSLVDKHSSVPTENRSLIFPVKHYGSLYCHFVRSPNACWQVECLKTYKHTGTIATPQYARCTPGCTFFCICVSGCLKPLECMTHLWIECLVWQLCFCILW